MTSMNKNYWLFTLLLTPLLAVQLMHDFSLFPVLTHVLISASLALLLVAAQQLQSWFKSVVKLFLLTFYFVFLFMLLFEVILFDFTGRGFTNEVYFHFEIESLRIGFSQYPALILAFLSLVFVYIFLLNKVLKNMTQKKHFLFPVAALVVLLGLTLYSPVARFISGFNNYLWQELIELDQDLINQYVDLGVVQNNVLTTKKELEARAVPESKNLILVYLESFNKGLMDLDQYPDLTPQLNQLSQKYQNFNHFNSSYVTIEGLISSQCGTMLPMTAGNNTFLIEGQLMSEMPCLGDVLKKAEYDQYFLGGAQMEFAGKGHFLETHGYDHIWGLEHWKATGLRETKGIWGLSDSKLFKNALNTIKKAAQKPPYNVTILTLGTHLPGYVYEECLPYPGSDEPFINAIHCTDQLVGQFVYELEQTELLKNTVLLIVADHGVFRTPKMKELFGGVVDNRKLVGITNYQHLPDKKLSSYDLAPTVLDMLKVKHNALFIFGQSLFNKTETEQKHVTRYGDWHNNEMVFNPEGNCDANQGLSWPLNNCQKHQLLGLTSQLLAHYSAKSTSENLSCEFDIKFVYEKNKRNKKQWSMWINNENHIEHFYHKGYLLKTKNINSGTFIFVLNDELAIEKHIYIDDNEMAETQLNKIINVSDNSLLVIKSKLNSKKSLSVGERLNLQVEYHKRKTKLWTRNAATSKILGLNLCQAS